jgi:hypothetical protein
MPSSKRLSKSELARHLRELAKQAYEDGLLDDGTCLTREQALANLIWHKALGYTEVKKDDEGNEHEDYHPPEKWAIQLIWERMEGRVTEAKQEDTGRMSAAERVRELAKNRINAIAATASGETPPPPSLKK